MLALLGTLFGFAGSFFPEILKFFKAREDHKHELAVMELQIKAQEMAHTQRLEEINTQADITESQALYQHAEQKITGVKWADAAVSLYNSSVRPTVTYAFFVLYALVKYGHWQAVKAAGAGGLQALIALWTQDDMAIFCTIISYWFGQRAMRFFTSPKK